MVQGYRHKSLGGLKHFGEESGMAKRSRPAHRGHLAPGPHGDSTLHHPTWDAAGRTLWLGSVILKHFKRTAPNLELVLSAFQELNWAHCIDDPLTGVPGIDPKQHVHDTIKNLNRCLRPPLLHFHTDGTGREVWWAVRHGMQSLQMRLQTDQH